MPLWVMMCWPGPLIPRAFILFPLVIRSFSPNSWWGGRSNGGRKFGVSSLGQNVTALLGLWSGIGA